MHIRTYSSTRHRRVPSREFVAAWDHLVRAATLEASQVSRASRRRGRVARDRAAAASLALRGEASPADWRWFGGGLAGGVVIGAVGVMVLMRGRCGSGPVAEQAHTVADQRRAAAAVRERAGAAVEAAQNRTRAVARAVGDSARDTAGKVRHRLTRDDCAVDSESAGEATEPLTDRAEG